jgi:hypothetical protein
MQYTEALIGIPLCSKGEVIIYLRDTLGNLDNTTRVILCHDNQNLEVTWENIDNEIISTYT